MLSSLPQPNRTVYAEHVATTGIGANRLLGRILERWQLIVKLGSSSFPVLSCIGPQHVPG